MKQQTLPTLPEFINKVRNREDNLETIDPISPFAQSLKDLRLIYDFTDKIMQQPHLSNFIPCVEENGVWKPIEEPKPIPTPANEDFDFNWDYDQIEVDQYQTALSKVLFSGWSYRKIESSKNRIYIENETESFSFDAISGNLIGIETLNDLTTLKIPLTETGVIEFNLKF